MKKIFLSVLLTLCSLIIFSQPVFYKAYDISFGTREDNDSAIEWIVKNKEVQILIAYEDDKIKVYANETQIYRLADHCSPTREQKRLLRANILLQCYFPHKLG